MENVNNKSLNSLRRSAILYSLEYCPTDADKISVLVDKIIELQNSVAELQESYTEVLISLKNLKCVPIPF